MSTQPPVWLLDVDGVLNASRPGWSSPPRTAAVWAYGERWRLRFAPQLMDRIWRLSQACAVEIRWATSWTGHTAAVANALALPAFPDALADTLAHGPGGPPSAGVVMAAKTGAAIDVLTAA